MAMDPPVPSICLGELILCNDYKNEGGSFYEMGYVYTVNNYGFSGDYAGSYFNYSHGSGGGGTGGGSGVSLPVIKITDKLTGKAKCLNTLLSDKGNSFVQKLLSNFAGISEFDIEIASLDNVFADDAKTREINGSTALNKNSRLMIINISTSRLEGQAALDGARVILHEYIHADIYRKLNTSNKNDIDSRDFKTVFEAYEKNQHNVMANLYLNSMKEALKEFHKTALKNDYDRYVNYYGKAPTDEFYEAMAWGGLKDNDVKAWKDLSPEKKASYKRIMKNYIFISIAFLYILTSKAQEKIKDTLYFDLDNSYIYESEYVPNKFLLKDKNSNEQIYFIATKVEYNLKPKSVLCLKKVIRVPQYYSKKKKEKLDNYKLLNFLTSSTVYLVRKKNDKFEYINVNPIIEHYD